MVAFSSTTPSVTSIVDSGGSTYTRLQAANSLSSSRVELWEAHNVVASTSITVNLSASVKSRVEVGEYSGVQSLAVMATNTGSGTAGIIPTSARSGKSGAL